jgi:hypothetical protein
MDFYPLKPMLIPGGRVAAGGGQEELPLAARH